MPKKIKTEASSVTMGEFHNQEYSLFLSNDFRYKLMDNYESLDHESKLYKFLINNSFLFKDDPIFKPLKTIRKTTVSRRQMLALDVFWSHCLVTKQLKVSRHTIR